MSQIRLRIAGAAGPRNRRPGKRCFNAGYAAVMNLNPAPRHSGGREYPSQVAEHVGLDNDRQLLG